MQQKLLGITDKAYIKVVKDYANSAIRGFFKTKYIVLHVKCYLNALELEYDE